MKGGSRDVQGVLRTARGPVYEGTPGKGGSRDAQGIFRTSCGPVYEGTPREDPGMLKGSSGHHVGLCMRGHQGRIPGCPRDPLDSKGACV